jgi:predicted nuclease of predicted toxin-antitoxin system
LKILLDECVDRRFRSSLPGYEVSTVQEMGWAGTKNGELIKKAQVVFQAFITVDRNLYFQQNLAGIALSVVVLQAPSNRLSDLRKLAPQLLAILRDLGAGEVVQLSL